MARRYFVTRARERSFGCCSNPEDSPDELLKHLDTVGLSKFDMPEYFLRLDEIPLTPNGKMLKRAIVDWIKEGRVTPEPIRFEAKRASA